MYESASTRWHKQGRTETIRSVSRASLKFVRAMSDPSSAVSYMSVQVHGREMRELNSVVHTMGSLVHDYNYM